METHKIFIDPGHYTDHYNASPVVKGYYESACMYNYAGKLKGALEKVGFSVGSSYNLTGSTEALKARDKDVPVYTRGQMSKGYDLFLSLHSNACDTESVDRVVAIRQGAWDGSTIYTKSNDAAELLVPVIQQTMNISTFKIYDKKGNNGDYYGVLRGAASVGTPGVILEHSFHTNRKATEWLMNENNLDKLAENTANALAGFYGIEPVKPSDNSFKCPHCGKEIYICK